MVTNTKARAGNAGRGDGGLGKRVEKHHSRYRMSYRHEAMLMDDRELEVWRQQVEWTIHLAQSGHGEPDDIAVVNPILLAIDAEQRWRKRERLSVPGSWGVWDRVTIERIKEQTDLVSLIQNYGDPLRKAGQNFRGQCPIHDGDNPTALVVDPERGLWHCHACGAGGDALDWLTQRWRLVFNDAVRTLAREAGIEVPERRPQPLRRKRQSADVRRLEATRYA